MLLNIAHCGDIFGHLKQKSIDKCPACGNPELVISNRVLYLAHNPAPNSVATAFVNVKCDHCKHVLFFELEDVTTENASL